MDYNFEEDVFSPLTSSVSHCIHFWAILYLVLSWIHQFLLQNFPSIIPVYFWFTGRTASIILLYCQLSGLIIQRSCKAGIFRKTKKNCLNGSSGYVLEVLFMKWEKFGLWLKLQTSPNNYREISYSIWSLLINDHNHIGNSSIKCITNPLHCF